MDSATKSLSHVFGRLRLSGRLINGLGSAEIQRIVINKRKKHMHIHMLHTAVVNEALFQELQDQISAELPIMESIDIQMQYNLDGYDLAVKLDRCRDNILYMVNTHSRLCYLMLRNACWEVNGNLLLIKLKHNASFILTVKGIDKKIQSYIQNRFDELVHVKFEDGIEDTAKRTMEPRIAEASMGTAADMYGGMQGIPRPTQSAASLQHTFPLLPQTGLSQQVVPLPQQTGLSQQSVPLSQQTDPLLQQTVPISKQTPAPDTTPRPSVPVATQTPPSSAFGSRQGYKPGGRTKTKFKKNLTPDDRKMSQPIEQDEDIIVQGVIFAMELRETKTGRYLVTFDMTDGSDSLTVKFFSKPSEYGSDFKDLLKKGNSVVVKGKVQYDEYARELNLKALAIGPGKPMEMRMDRAEEKRVELHLHTQMSAMDGVTAAKAYIKRAAAWGHKAIAITDHGVVQAFPEAMEAAEGTGVKVLYGVEAYIVDDLGAVVQCPGERMLDDTYVVFDLETTGLKAETDRIIQIGAVKLQNGVVTARFSTFVDPKREIPAEITKLTGITDEMVNGAPGIAEALVDFLAFAGDAVYVAHNAGFDMGFVSQAARSLGLTPGHTVLDTVALSRLLFPTLPKHKLDVVAKHLGISLENHHRAVDDAEATAAIFQHCVMLLQEKGAATLRDINLLAGEAGDKSKLKYTHAVIFARNQTGLRNLYELVSNAHIHYFRRRPRIPKSDYLRLREGLIIGSGCEAGELFRAVRDHMPDEYIRELADFYDYYEIQPIGNNMYLLRDGKVGSVQELQELNRQIVALGEKHNKPVAATCDVHFIDPEDEVYRRIIMSGDGFKDADNQAPLFFRTTEEMLAEFAYLGEEKAREVVVTNTNRIADMIDALKPMPDGTFAPEIDGAEQMLTDIIMEQARKIYGDPLPQIVSDRLDKELNSIIKNGFAVMYVIAQKLVAKSMEDGYLVGSRGSVGSSLAATMAGITEVNPLAPHYICHSCRYSDFDSAEVSARAGGSGCDLPDKDCPVCGAPLGKEGHDIPFETFLGFDGDKEPDIDLNFSGEYQARAHAYTEELFGTGYVFKAGTIGTLAEKTAYGYVRKYLDERNVEARAAEINRLKTGCTGIRKSTGQHPGGLMVVPAGHSIYEFSPIQRPANDMNTNVTTTHFDYNAIKGRLLKLDILGHDVPTIIRMLHDITGVDPLSVPLSDPKVMSLFTSPAAMEVSAEEINCKTGSLGLPEFGTNFVRQMLLDTQPSVFSDLVRISGLSHGTDVWLNNAQELIRNGDATLRDIIPSRDDIMVYLINQGVEKKAAFKIMEDVRKGKGVKEEQAVIMEEAGIPDWYIQSCQKIKYLFPKGHAVAYVTMTVRIGYYKVYYPYSFYAATFSVKAEEFDYEMMCRGAEVAKEAIAKIAALGKDVTAKDKNNLTLLELAVEMYARGLQFAPLDLYRAEARKFLVTSEGLMPPLCSVQGLGVSVAQNIVEARREGEFFTVEDFRERTKTNKTVIDLLKKHEILKGIPDTNQLTLF